MEKCRIAILDSGIDKLFFSSKDIVLDGDAEDENGHGTMCYSIIKSLAANSEFYISKILNRELLTTSENLLCKLEEISKLDVDLVHLSLSTSDFRYKEEMEMLCKKLYDDGKIVVASHDNNMKKQSFPCDFNTVIGVGAAMLSSNKAFIYNDNSRIQTLANKVPSLVRGENGIYKFFGGTSKSAACMTGIIANEWDQFKILRNKEQRDALLKFLAKESQKKIQKNIKIEVLDFVENQIMPQITDDFNERIACQVLKEFEYKFHICVNFEDILLLDFSSPEQLSIKLSQLL